MASRRLAVFALVVAILAILLNRSDVLTPIAAVTTFAAVGFLAAFAILLAFGGIVRIWHRGHLGLGSALVGLAIGSALLVWPSFLAWETMTMPTINDIATDWDNPPEMRAAVLDRSRFSNPVRKPSAEEIETQKSSYPEIGPLVVNFPSQRVYEAARTLARERGWKLLEQAPPDERGPGKLELVARTPIMGFKDDVVIVVTNLGDGRTRVDMRSASRYGRHDFGTNASRIYDFLTELESRMRAGLLS